MNCIENGNRAEVRFDRCMIKKLHSENIYNFQLLPSSKEKDMRDHIDRTLLTEYKKNTFDVKAMKKDNRSDEDTMNDKTWVEFVNVNGNPGWIYGKATHIAFEVEDGFLLVNRKKLLNKVEEKCVDKTIYYENPKECYKYYSRKKYGRNDLTIKVPIEDIEKISDMKITD